MKSNLNIKQRFFKDRSIFVIVCVFSLLSSIPLIAILGEVFVKGISQFSLSFFTLPTPTAYKVLKAVEQDLPIPGGIANGIIGSMIMLLIASAVAIPLGILCGAYIADNSKQRFAKFVSYLTDLLQGTPSVIIGIITYIWIVIPMKTYSALAGSIALCIMMLPLIIRSTEETLRILPSSLKEAGLALGANKAKLMLKVQLPSAFGGIFTGILLAISRVIGETAPLMFTALGCSFIRLSLDKPISAVPLLIWEFFNDPYQQELIWGASLFLLTFVLTLNLLSKYLTRKWKK